MRIWESIRIAFRALSANKLRASLTMLGMIIGVGAVITLMSVGRGAQEKVVAQVKALGTNLLFITPGSTTQSGVRTGAGSAQTLTMEDAEAIVTSGAVPSVTRVAPEFRANGQFVAGGVNVNAPLIGVTPDYLDVRNYQLADGEFIGEDHVNMRSLVAVLGAGTKEDLYGEESPVDQTLRINGRNVRVVGVLQSKGSQASGNQDDLVLVPISTMQARFARQMTARGGRYVSSITAQAADERMIDQAVAEIGDLLRERHRVTQDDFTVRSQQDMQAASEQITGTFTLLLGSIAGISLIVGGIGIMNIMLVSVTERTREIGLRKAVGAKRRDILLQFLVEAVVVSLIGGALGVLTGIGLSRVVENLQYQGQTLQTVVAPDAIVLAFAVSAAIGLFFGIYPATRAGRLNPIDALRYE